jgi:NADPH:quinone reductase
MKAIRMMKNGGPEVLRVAEITLSPPGPGQARVKLQAAGINFIDTYQRRGRYEVPLPYTPGLEGAGTITDVGPGVTGFKTGDRVAYAGQLGSYAEENNVDVQKLISLPSDLSFEEGAAFPLQGMTAHYLIHEFSKPSKDSTVLIHAASGGMGLLLVQWAKHLGARVIGTVSTKEKATLARQAGADEIILYREQDFVAETLRLTNGKGVDLIIDGVGKSTFPGDLQAARVRGHVVLFGSASGPADPVAPNSLQARSLTVSGGSLGNYTLSREEMIARATSVLEGMRAGWLKFRIGDVLPLEAAAEAHRRLEDRETTGKVLLKL